MRVIGRIIKDKGMGNRSMQMVMNTQVTGMKDYMMIMVCGNRKMVINMMECGDQGKRIKMEFTFEKVQGFAKQNEKMTR